MNLFFLKILILVAIVLGIGGFFILNNSKKPNEVAAALDTFFIRESERISDVEKRIAEIQITSEEEDFFFVTLQEGLSKEGVTFSRQELKKCCELELDRVLKIIKLKEETKKESRDLRRRSDLRIIALAMVSYYFDGDEYPQSRIAPTSIGLYLTEVPKDPSTNNPYHWLDNTSLSTDNCNSQQYCIWAELESGGYEVANGLEIKNVDSIPLQCPC